MLSRNDVAPRRWRKSTKSEFGGCVEVRFADGGAQVRNSRDPGGPILSFTAAEWSAFLGGVMESEFELPAD